MATEDLIKLLESLHPLEYKVILSFDRADTLSSQELPAVSGLDDSRLDMASGWLQPKGLLDVKEESITSFVSLTETGTEYLEKGTPEMRIINALKEGKQFTVKDVIQSWGMEPTEVSSATGELKHSGVIKIVQGGVLELNKDADLSRYDFVGEVIKDAAAGPSVALSGFPKEKQAVIQENFHKRGKAKGIFRVTEKKNRLYSLTTDGKELLRLLKERGTVTEEESLVTPDMLKTGAWKNKKFRAYNISLKPPEAERRQKASLQGVSRFRKVQIYRHGL